jgi:NTP pyrophosphatase (non-canonical NTP hydrolase)
MQSLNELAKTSHEVSRSKGWWEPGSNKSDAALISLMHSEVSEALEDYRHNHLPSEYWLDGSKPCGVPSELADVVIRIGDYFGGRNLDLEDAHKRTIDLDPIKDFEDGLARIHHALSMAFGESHEFSPAISKGTTAGKTFWLATALRYTFDLAKVYDIDLWYHINLKTEFNKTRSHRHGGKRI